MLQNPDSKRSTKDDIKEAFLSVYAKKPLSQILIRELTTACHISRSTFYFYYEDINSLLYECMKDCIEYMRSSVPSVVLYSVGHEHDGYLEHQTELLERIKEQKDLISVLLTGSESAIFERMWFDDIYENHAKAIKFFKRLDSDHRNLLARFFAAGTQCMLKEWILDDCRKPTRMIATIRAQAQFYGMYDSKHVIE